MKVVLTDYSWPLDIEKKALDNIGAQMVIPGSDDPLSVLSAIKDADVIIQSGFKITKDCIDSLENCKAIVHTGIGVDTIDVKAATEKGIIVANVVGHCYDEVTIHTLALLLSAWRKIVISDNQVRNNQWSRKNLKPIFRLSGAVLGIIGFGNIGRELARKVKPLGLATLVYDPYQTEKENSKFGTELVGLEELCTRSDIISIHCPLTEKTKHLIGRKELDLMNEHTYIINTARGAIINEEALIDALQKNKIAGAALDVLEKEPPDYENPLLKLSNVILTPHQAFYSEESIMELRKGSINACIKVLTNRWPDSVVNPVVMSNSKHKEVDKM